jgi:hypothetical protein
MNETNEASIATAAATSTPAPAPAAGEGQPTSSPAPNEVPTPEKAVRSPGEFNKEVEAELTKASDICTVAQKETYAPGLARRGIAATFIVALVADIKIAGQKSESAVNCDGAAGGAALTEADAAKTLLGSLRTIQSAARAQHLPENPAALDKYLVGEPLAESRPLLERTSSALINNASTERPGGIDTVFLDRVQNERAAFVNANQTQDNELSKGQGDRTQRDALVKSIIARRKKIQYAADTEWPPHQPDNAQARKDFKLPAKRPYSY